MKYPIRTVTWRFQEATESLPELVHLRNLRISSPKVLFENYRPLFDNLVRERFVVFWLTTCNSVLGFEVISEGLVNTSLVHPREVFRGAIVATACFVILAHNHPSGNAEPSEEDIQITKQLVFTGDLLGIPVHDHVIFAGSEYTSFAERGLI